MMRTDLTPFLNEHPSIEIVERTSGKVTLHCKDCGNTWAALPNDVLRSKYGCKNCYELSKKTTPQQWADQIHALYPDYLLKFPDEPYLWKSAKIDYCCPVHGWQNTHIGTILERGCRKCNRLKGNEKLKQATQKTFQDEGYDEMVEILKKDDITVLTPKEECKGASFRVEVRCNVCNSKWKATIYDLTHGHGCKSCSSSRVTEEDFRARLTEEWGDNYEYRLLTNWTNLRKTKIEITCKIHGTSRKISADRALHSPCLLCGKESANKNRAIDRETNPEKYKEAAKKSVETFRKNGSEKRTGRKLYNYHGLYFDSKDEIYVYSYLEDNKIEAVPQKNILYETPEGKKAYVCDFYLPETSQYWEVKGASFFTEDGKLRSVWKKGLSEEALAKRTRTEDQKLKTLKNLGVILITNIYAIPDNWSEKNPEITLTDIAQYEQWFSQHHELSEINKKDESEFDIDAFVRKYCRVSWDLFKAYDFPYPEAVEKKIVGEINALKEGKNPKGSTLIRAYHPSLYLGYVHGRKSPVGYWEYLKTDYEAYKKLYINRLKYADSREADLFRKNGILNASMTLYGLEASRIAPKPSYVKPFEMKKLIEKYASEYDTVFDPFSGYSGRMLGCLFANKNYIGRDINETTIKESKSIYEKVRKHVSASCLLEVQSVLETKKESHDCLFTCPPYEDIESWEGTDLVVKTCDEWIDECLKRFKCKRYVFIVDDKIKKYKEYVKEELENVSHFGKNKEYVVVIDK